jgi:hypothetical protein
MRISRIVLTIIALQEAKREAGLGLLPSEPAGARCLRARGLDDAQLDRFANTSGCVGRSIQERMGVGNTANMVSDYILAPGRSERLR